MKIDIEKIKESKTTEELLKFSLINIDKPSGPTSFTVSHFVKTALNLNKTSHMGTLDPMVSGVLPIALNRACRLNEYLMHRDKEYVGIMRLHEDISDEKLKEEMKKFTGKISQLPPVKSRVKRQVREREIKKFEILERDGKDILFLADVQAGTYIRKLISDLGESMGGAHMLELRRIKAGIFSEHDKTYPSITLYDFEKAVDEYKKGNDKLLRKMLIPGEIVADYLPAFQLEKKQELSKLLTGKPLMRNEIKSDAIPELFILFDNLRFIGIYRRAEEGDIIAKPEFVFN